MLTNKREEEYDGAFDDLQAALRGSAGQPSGADVLVPAGGVPERVLSSPPESRHQEEASRQRVALKAPHHSQRLNRGRKQINNCCHVIFLLHRFPLSTNLPLILVIST